MSPENKAKADSFLIEYARETAYCQSCNQVDILKAMSAYGEWLSTHSEQQAVKKALGMVKSILTESAKWAEDQGGEYSKGVTRGIKHSIAIIDPLLDEPAIL
jgi:hypothetical protein